MKLKVNPDGSREFDGSPDELAQFLAKYDRELGTPQPNGVPASGVAGAGTGSSTVVRTEDPVAKPKRKWPTRHRPNRNDTKHTYQERLTRAVTALTVIANARRGHVLAQAIGKPLNMENLAGLGAVVKDINKFVGEVGFTPGSVMTIRGQSPRRYHREREIQSALASLRGLLENYSDFHGTEAKPE